MIKRLQELKPWIRDTTPIKPGIYLTETNEDFYKRKSPVSNKNFIRNAKVIINNKKLKRKESINMKLL